MTSTDRVRVAPDELRREAARRLHERQPAQTATMSEAELRVLVNELQVRQIELEMENEALRRTPAVADTFERKQVERLLIDSEAQSRLLMDSIPAYISYVDPDERYRWVNRAYELLFCRPRSEIIGRTIAELQEESHYRNMQPYVRQALAGSKVHYENTFSNAQGESQVFDTNYIPHAADDGTILGFIVLVFDITERKQFERSLRLTQFSIDHAVDSVFWIAPDGEILYVNDAACRTLGYDREEILGKTVPEIDPNFPAEAWPAHWEEIRQRKSFTFESDHYTKTGELIHTEVTVNYLVFEGREYNCAMMRNITEQKEAQAKMSQLAAIVTSSEDAIISKTLDGMITSWNESATRLFGYTEAEMIGTPITRIFPPDRIDEELEILCMIHGGKRVEHLETIRIKRDGTPIHVSVTISPIKNAAGEITGASKTVRDITIRRRAEEALRESEERFQAFMNQSPVVAWLKDENFKFRYINNALEKLFNLPADQILGRTDYDLYDKQDADITRANDERVLASDEILQDIEQVIGSDGRPRQWLVQKFPLHRTGQPTWTGGTAVDVTDRREAEQQLQESNERFRLLFESSYDAIFWADADTGILIECNRAAEKLLGRERDEIIGQAHTILHPAENTLRLKKIFEAYAQGKRQGLIELDIARKDGSRVAVSISPTVTTIGEKKILQGIFRDITERKQAEQAIREGNRKYSALFEQAAISVAELESKTGCFLRVNKYLAELLGYSVEELLQLDCPSITHAADLQENANNLALLNAGVLRMFQMEKRLLRKDGAAVWVRLTVLPLWAENEPVTSNLAFVEDITQRILAENERQKAEEELRRSEERFSKLYAASPVAILVAAFPDGSIVEVNEAFTQLFKYDAADILGKKTQDISIWADLEDRKRMLEEFQRDGSVRNRETCFLTKQGEPRIVLFSAELIQLDGQSHSLTMSIDITARKQAEEALRKSEERYQLVICGVNDGIWDWNVLTGKAYVSPRHHEILGLAHDELLVDIDTFFDAVHPEDRAAVETAVRRHFEQHERYEIELRARRPDGSYRWILSRGESIRNADGKPIRMVGSITDITARKQADEALRKSEERYQLVIRGVNDGIWDWNLLTNEEFHSPRWNEILGYEDDELPQHFSSFFDLVHPEDRAGVVLAIQGNLERNERYEVELRIRQKSGGYCWILTRGETVRDAAGQPIRMVGSITDISNRKAAEQALRDSEQRYRSFIENCADSVYLLDTAGKIRAANPAALRMHGYTLDELLTMNIQDLNDPANAQIVPERLSLIQSGGTLQFDTVHQRKDGTCFPTEVRATPVLIGNEQLILAFDRDITERKRSEEQTNRLREELAYTSRLVTLREMASGLAHELNQPLTALSLYVGSAMELAAPYKSTHLNECLRRIDHQLQHSGEIIRSMRAFAKRSPANREYININLLINDVMALLAGELKKSETITTLQLDADVVPVLTNAIQIKQVLVNLIRNGLEAVCDCAGCERKLVIRTEKLENQVRVSVSDTGPGLDPAIAKRLFLPFQTTKPEGLGMGLSICRTLIEALGGRIDVSRSSANGTTFYFDLPYKLDLTPNEDCSDSLCD